VPDVALNADTNTGYAIYFDGQWTIYGGTSCAAPLWAAFTACVNEHRTASQKPTLGFANPLLYAIAASSAYGDNFHDITTGSNLYYTACEGYDNASGWGSFNGGNLFASLTNTPTPTPPPPPPPPQKLTPVLNITMSGISTFRKGGTAAYQIGVSNHGNGSTTEPVTVTVDLPYGLTYRLARGSGWTINGSKLTFTASSDLPAGGSYPAITLYVHVTPNAPTSVTASATVTGGGAASSHVSTHTSIK
jgi:kumamolisin